MCIIGWEWGETNVWGQSKYCRILVEHCAEAVPGAVEGMSGGPWILKANTRCAVGIQSGYFVWGLQNHSLSPLVTEEILGNF